MGNITSIDLLSAERLSAVRTPSNQSIENLSSVEVTAALDLVEKAFHNQDPTRTDMDDFRWRRTILQTVLKRVWDGLDAGERLRMWEGWKAFLLGVVRGGITQVQSFDLLDDALVHRYGLSTIREVYVDSIFTPQELLKRIKVLYGKGVATSLLKELERRVRREFGTSGRKTKEEIVAELQRAVNDLEYAKSVHGEQVQDHRDQAVFDLQHLLNNVFGADEAHGARPMHLAAPSTSHDSRSLSPNIRDPSGRRSRASSSASHRSISRERRQSAWRWDQKHDEEKGLARRRTASPRRTPSPPSRLSMRHEQKDGRTSPHSELHHDPMELDSLSHNRPLLNRRQRLIYRL